MNLTEAQTRAKLIDRQLAAADWDLKDKTQVGLEVPVDGYDAEPWNGITDYCLYKDDGAVLAVVEAKKTARDPREGEEQLRHYLSQIGMRQGFAPFGFMANGKIINFWEMGQANPRAVAGFFTREDLNRFLHIFEHRRPLESIPINNTIVERPYQHEAIRRVAEAFAQNRRRALLVMATGTGKTRTTMAIIDLFLRAGHAKNFLFLADRDALVDQAITDGFKAHLPSEPRDRIYTHTIDKTKRLFVATEQTLSVCFQKFSPGFFDVIIFDEAHRSIFRRFSEVIEYFDARMIGLTATPATFIERDTFRLFNCENNTPTFLYDYPQAVQDKWLVDFLLYKAQTGFQRKGIRGVELTDEERNALIEQGIDPDTIDYSGTDIEVHISNRDTLRKQIQEFMEVSIKDQGGQLPGKTIFFAMTKKHAERIRDVFEEMYPQHVGLVQVITSSTERVRDGTYGDGLISKFKKNDLPRIAISVDMLDTGVDIPEVVNLVFMKPVFSRIKLWQMIGRGTRNDAVCKYRDRLPNGRKVEFKIIDFWQNDFVRKADPEVSAQLPILVSVFNTRLNLLERAIGDPGSELAKQTITDVRAMIGRIPLESFPVRKCLEEVETARNDEFWRVVTRDRIEFLRLRIGPLLRHAADVDVAAETFTHKCERLKLQSLMGNTSPELQTQIAEDVARLPAYVHEDQRSGSACSFATSKKFARATPAQITEVIQALAPHMRNRRDRESSFLKIDLPDFIAERGLISIGEGGEQIYVEEYRRRVEQRILDIVEKHPAIAAIRLGVGVTEEQLIDLERKLQQELGGGDLRLTHESIRRAYGWKVTSFLGFLRHLLELEAIPDYSQVVEKAFENHIASRQYNADQIRFLRAVQSVFLQKRSLEEGDLYEPPLTAMGRNAVERFFTHSQIKELLELTVRLSA